MPRGPAALVAVVAATIVTIGCATTVDEQPAAGDGTLLAGTFVDESAPATTAPIAGSAAELLPEMAATMSQLSALIAEGGNDDDAALASIVAMWAAARDEVESTRPELVGGIETTVEMSRTAVERRRPADADKAFRLLTQLVDNFTGDG